MEEVEILKGVVSKDHIHIHIEYPSWTSIAGLVKWMKGRSSRLFQKELSGLKTPALSVHGGLVQNNHPYLFYVVIVIMLHVIPIGFVENLHNYELGHFRDDYLIHMAMFLPWMGLVRLHLFQVDQ